MLAVLYLIIACVLGDALCRRFFTFASLGHRLAAAVFAGLLVSTWGTYGLAYLFQATGSPMLWGNAAFMTAAVAAIVLLKWRPDIDQHRETNLTTEFIRWDWVFVGVFLVVATWMMFSTFAVNGDRLQIGNHQWSDFGSNVSIMQSFAVGHNFPTEYPHFSGDRIRYHFLFYFQAGNLEYLGLNPALANNILSIITLVSMLMLVMTLGAVLFASRTVGRIGALLFFFHGSLAYIPFLAKSGSFSETVSKIWTMRSFLSSGLPYRGEDWGVWSQVVYLNQRHFASSIGILLLVIIFLVIRQQQLTAHRAAADTNEDEAGGDPSDSADEDSAVSRNAGHFERYRAFVLAGCLLGLLPMWNGAVFVGAAAVLTILLLLLSLKREMLVMGIVTGLLALPQVLYLKTGAKPADYSLFYWGYIVNDPTLSNVTYYLFFTFGFKWLLIIAALIWGTGLQRKIMAALTSLLLVAFCFQFSEEVLANHKFLNIWLVGANLFVAYALVRLWQLKVGPMLLPSRVLAVVLVGLISLGGIIDLVVIKNTYWVEAKFDGDPLVEWIKLNTDPRAIFLSNRYVNHGILLAGRRLFYGHPYYAWGAGYPTRARDVVYKQMFESRNPAEVYDLIRANGISYVAIDDALRKNDFVRNLNETVFEKHFPVVFNDVEKKYDNLKIFLVPEDLALPTSMVSSEQPAPVAPAANAFAGGSGSGGGQFVKPRGISTDNAGNLYVADTGNSRIQKFTPDGVFLLAFGASGSGQGELREPNGVAVDSQGRIYVVDAFSGKLVRFAADGTFEREWRGPEPGFYGPRDIIYGPNMQIYIVDQGRTRIVRFDPATEVFSSWGERGSGPGQFLESTGIAIGGGAVYVTDLGNNRIQVFDLDGTFLRMWEVPQWGKYPWHYPDAAYDGRSQRLYISNGWKNELLVFDVNGNPVDPDFERPPALQNPSSMAMSHAAEGRRLLVLNTDGSRVEAIRLSPPK